MLQLIALLGLLALKRFRIIKLPFELSEILGEGIYALESLTGIVLPVNEVPYPQMA